jgi:hypothetical protein
VNRHAALLEQLDRRRQIEAAQRRLRRLAYGAEQRITHANLGLPAPDETRRPARGVHLRDQVGQRTDGEARADELRGRGRRAPTPRRRGFEDPVARELPGPRHHVVIRVAFGPQETEHRRHRREVIAAVAQAIAVEPMLIEVDPLREEFLKRFGEARREQASGL